MLAPLVELAVGGLSKNEWGLYRPVRSAGRFGSGESDASPLAPDTGTVLLALTVGRDGLRVRGGRDDEEGSEKLTHSIVAD